MIIVSNTTPLHYLILLEASELLPQLFGQVIVPDAVIAELQHASAPDKVRQWLTNIPAWLEIRSPVALDPTLNFGSGENAAISLAQELHADGILLDDRKARLEAMRRGLAVAGTINILDIAAEKQMLDLPTAFRKLQNTNFRVSAALLQEFLDRDATSKANY